MTDIPYTTPYKLVRITEVNPIDAHSARIKTPCLAWLLCDYAQPCTIAGMEGWTAGYALFLDSPYGRRRSHLLYMLAIKHVDV